MRFADTRPDPDDGRKHLRLSAGQIIAEAFAGGAAVRMPPGFGARKDKHRSPMSLRWQAAFWAIQTERRLEALNARKAKRAAKLAAREAAQ